MQLKMSPAFMNTIEMTCPPTNTDHALENIQKIFANNRREKYNNIFF